MVLVSLELLGTCNGQIHRHWGSSDKTTLHLHAEDGGEDNSYRFGFGSECASTGFWCTGGYIGAIVLGTLSFIGCIYCCISGWHLKVLRVLRCFCCCNWCFDPWQDVQAIETFMESDPSKIATLVQQKTTTISSSDIGIHKHDELIFPLDLPDVDLNTWESIKEGSSIRWSGCFKQTAGKNKLRIHVKEFDVTMSTTAPRDAVQKPITGKGMDNYGKFEIEGQMKRVEHEGNTFVLVAFKKTYARFHSDKTERGNEVYHGMAHGDRLYGNWYMRSWHEASEGDWYLRACSPLVRGQGSLAPGHFEALRPHDAWLLQHEASNNANKALLQEYIDKQLRGSSIDKLPMTSESAVLHQATEASTDETSEDAPLLSKGEAGSGNSADLPTISPLQPSTPQSHQDVVN